MSNTFRTGTIALAVSMTLGTVPAFAAEGEKAKAE